MPATDFQQKLEGFGLTTANIFYHRPDYPAVLQSFLWQRHDFIRTIRSYVSFSAFGRANSTACCIPSWWRMHA